VVNGSKEILTYWQATGFYATYHHDLKLLDTATQQAIFLRKIPENHETEIKKNRYHDIQQMIFYAGRVTSLHSNTLPPELVYSNSCMLDCEACINHS